ncbi:ergothioneine biosynthesis protein EgtB [Jiulongibacter sp. NS-SX5]|uniref:ergothioneine biosynthesis protein EgtB n=1 Tax=Jiulongibacter sp. NS-SX5 TaxID=3463854 RepID=UPI004058B685
MIKDRFLTTRIKTEEICAPLAIEDYSVQPMVDVSPPKWHLAHSTWFFEAFVLQNFDPDYKVYDEDFAYLFNSYYNNAGERVLRPNRGLMTRPTVSEVMDYRKAVTDAVLEFIERKADDKALEIIELGINHEQQHQELLYYDIKYILGHQPTFPVYHTDIKLRKEKGKPKFIKMNEGIYEIGYKGEGFSYDNELGRHKVFLHKYSISNRLVNNAEYLEFIEDGGYNDFNLWHAEGWDFIQKNELKAPLYWHKTKEGWQYYNFNGLEQIDPDLPVNHISMYEAFAFAEWKGARLPTEFEWEAAADQFKWDQLWEWTNSAYLPYPGFSKAPGALGEYNGKFMVNLHVLRGASLGTYPGHSRKTYRNFFHTSSRWVFAGLRLAK